MGLKIKNKNQQLGYHCLKKKLRSVPWRHTTNTEVRVSSAENSNFSMVSSA